MLLLALFCQPALLLEINTDAEIDAALLKMLYLATQDVMRKWTRRIPNWGQILWQLSIFFRTRSNLVYVNPGGNGA